MNTHSIGWAKATAILFVKDGLGLHPASDDVPCSVRMIRDAFLIRAPLTIKATRFGASPEICFYIRDKLIVSVPVPYITGEGQTVTFVE